MTNLSLPWILAIENLRGIPIQTQYDRQRYDFPRPWRLPETHPGHQRQRQFKIEHDDDKDMTMEMRVLIAYSPYVVWYVSPRVSDWEENEEELFYSKDEVCTECPLGRYNPLGGGTSVDECILCGPGKYRMNSHFLTKSAVTVVLLELSSTKRVQNSTRTAPHANLGNTLLEEAQQIPLALAICRLCSQGQYNPLYGAIECLSCQPGKMSHETRAFCKDCPATQYQDQFGQSSCIDCGTGKFTSIPGRDMCTSCPKGFIQPNPKSRGCEKCSQGLYLDEIGRIECKLCEKGRYTDELARSDVRLCKECPRGRYQQIEGATSFQNCSNCTAGKFGKEGDVSVRISPFHCKDCPKGKYSEELASNSELRCKLCDLGKYNVDVGQYDRHIACKKTAPLEDLVMQEV